MRAAYLWGGLAVAALLLLSSDSEKTPFDDALKAASARYRLPWPLLREVARQESGFDAAAYNSASGASGLMQFMPATAAEYGVDVWSPVSSINGAARYLFDLKARFGSWPEALAAYNWGPGNLSKKGLASAPLETRNYTEAISGRSGIPFNPPWG